MGLGANKILAYGVASVSGTVLAVCSCTVLPLFAGIYRMGAGLGPATAFLYAGPAINVLAIILTARVLGLEIGVARAVGAVAFSIVIGLLMHLIYRREESGESRRPGGHARAAGRPAALEERRLLRLDGRHPHFRQLGSQRGHTGDLSLLPRRTTVYKVEGTLVNKTAETVTILDTDRQDAEVPADLMLGMEDVQKNNAYELIYRFRWALVAALLAAFAFMAGSWFSRGELHEWLEATWGFAKQILPLLLIGVLVSGLLFGRPGPEHKDSFRPHGSIRPWAATRSGPISWRRWPGPSCISPR